MCVIIFGWFSRSIQKYFTNKKSFVFLDLFVVLLTEGPLVGEVGATLYTVHHCTLK